jgi:hypothetical protein
MDRVFFDSNTGNEQEGYVLDFEQSKLDIKKMGSRARDGTVILLYMPDELEVKAEMRFDPALDCWRGFPKGEFKVL